MAEQEPRRRRQQIQDQHQTDQRNPHAPEHTTSSQRSRVQPTDQPDRGRARGEAAASGRVRRQGIASVGKGKERSRTLHFFLNPAAAQFKRRAVDRLLYRLRGGKNAVEVHEATSGMGLLDIARKVVAHAKEDKTSAHVLIAVGGDGTVNLIARATLEDEIPFGILPFGRENNISRSFYGTVHPEQTLELFSSQSQSRDAILAGDQLVLSAAGLGLLPSLHAHLVKKGPPRFGIGWGMLSSDLLKKQSPLSLTLKLDAHRLTVSTRILSIHLLPHAAGLNLSPMSNGTDSQFEVILDQGKKSESVSNYVRDAAAKQIKFGSGLAAYRCERVTLQSVRQQPLYLDGEVVTVPSDILEIGRTAKRLQVVGAQ